MFIYQVEQVENKLRIAGLNARPQIIETENGPELVNIIGVFYSISKDLFFTFQGNHPR